MSTSPINLDPAATSLAAAQANVLASTQAQVKLLNDNLTAIYLRDFDNWKISVDAGRAPNTNPPQPPTGYEVETGPDGFAYPVKGASPVCTMPPIPADHTKSTQAPIPEPDNIRAVPPGDVLPIGFIVVGSDGTRWQKQGSPTPFGTAYFYLKVA